MERKETIDGLVLDQTGVLRKK